MNKYKKLAFNTLIFTIGSFGSKILSFLLARLYTSKMLPDEFSTADLIVQTANLLIPIATLSITEGIIRFGLDRDFDKKHIYTTGFITTCIGLLILLLLSPVIHLVPSIGGYTILLLIYMVTSSFRMLNQYFIRSRGLVKLFSADGILTTLTMLIFNVIFIAVLNMGVLGYILSIILSDALSSVFMCLVADNLKYVQIKGLDKNVAVSMIRYSIPLIPTYILWWIVGLSDRYFIVYLIDDYANGLYSLANKIPSLINTVSTIFFQAWQMSAISEYKSEGARTFYTKVFDAYQSMMIVASAGILLFLKPIMRIIAADTEYYDGYIYVPVLLIGVLCCCLCQFLSSIYSASKHTKNSLWTSLVAAIVNIILNVILIPKMGVQGACISTLCSYGICFLIRVNDTRRYIKFKFNTYKFIINISLLAVMSATIVLDYTHLTIWLLCGFVIIAMNNYTSIMDTLNQFIKRKKKA